MSDNTPQKPMRPPRQSSSTPRRDSGRGDNLPLPPRRRESYDRPRRPRDFNSPSTPPLAAPTPRNPSRQRGISRRSFFSFRRSSCLLYIILCIFLGGGSVAGYYGYHLYNFSQKALRPAIGSINGTPLVAPDWAKKDRVNILLLGLDTRAVSQDGPPRSDTMILASIDPKNNTATMISIPRDLYVPIQGHGKDRINTAYGYAIQDKLPGGGPAGAIQVVQQNFGVSVPYYIEVDFKGFEKIVDTIGGIDVDVPHPLKDDEFPTENYGYMRIYIPAGLQHMNGKVALQYARSRHADSDLGRNQRQQQVVLAMRHQALQLNLITKLDTLMDNAGDAFKTDLGITDLKNLAQLGNSIPTENITNFAIDSSMTSNFTTADGADVLLPDWPAIHNLFTHAFSGDSRIYKESATVSVQNASSIEGLASHTRDFLVKDGINVTTVGSSTDISPRTVIYDYKGKKFTAARIAQLLNLPASAIIEKDPGSATDSSDIVVVLQADVKAVIPVR